MTFYYQDSDQWSGILKSMLATDSPPVPVQVTVAESTSVSCADNTVTVTIKPAAPIRAGTTLSIKGINAKPYVPLSANAPALAALSDLLSDPHAVTATPEWAPRAPILLLSTRCTGLQPASSTKDQQALMAIIPTSTSLLVPPTPLST